MKPGEPKGETQERVFEYVRQRILAREPPTVREVQLAMGFTSAESARYHLERLVTAGRLLQHRKKHRGYRLPKQPQQDV